MSIAIASADDHALTEQRLLADVADGSLDEFSLLEGALIASGTTDGKTTERHCSEFAKRIETIPEANDHESPAVAEAERIYRFLHSEFLTGEYCSTCTELDRALDDGDYNCVTATILYHCICQAHGLAPVAVATKTHVRSRLLGDRPFDVETTCREWFDVVRHNPDAQSYRTEQQVTRQLSDIELLAKIYYNRAVSTLETKGFDKAIALLRISLELDPADAPTRENMAAGINNWALAECDSGNFERAAVLIQQGSTQHPEFAPLSANDIYIHQRWMVFLCEERRFVDAMQILHAAHRRRPDVALFDRGRLVVCGQWAAWLLENGDLEGATRLFDQANGWCDQVSEISRYRSIAIRMAAERLARSDRGVEADTLVRWGLELDPSDPRLHEAANRLTTANL